MSKIKLLQCPFCGGEAILRGHCVFENAWMVECQNKKCRCKTEFAPKEKAIERWNTRKPMQEIVERLEDAKVCIVDDYTEEYEDMVFLEEAIEIIEEVGGIG